MTHEQTQTLKELIKTNPAGASAYLEAITDNQNNNNTGISPAIAMAREIVKKHREKMEKLSNQLKNNK